MLLSTAVVPVELLGLDTLEACFDDGLYSYAFKLKFLAPTERPPVG